MHKNGFAKGVGTRLAIVATLLLMLPQVSGSAFASDVSPDACDHEPSSVITVMGTEAEPDCSGGVGGAPRCTIFNGVVMCKSF